jgi:nucleoside-diphosphate-sugar epimerase
MDSVARAGEAGMKAAISGHDGFIGSHLADTLRTKGFEVAPISQNLLYVPDALRDFFEKERPDYVLHLAAYGNMANQKEAAMIFDANLVCTFNMLQQSLDVPYRAFIAFGTSSEYGRKSTAMSENDALAPETLYAATKAGATHLARAFAKQYGKPVFIVRPFSIYGPAEADFRFIPTVIRSMLTEKSFPLDEHANHDWTFIDDMVGAVLLVMDHAPKLDERYGVLNVGTGRMHSNKEVCETLKQISGRDYLAKPLPGLRRNDSSVWMCDNRLISSIGFKPRFTLAEGLRQTYDYFKKKYGSQS